MCSAGYCKTVVEGRDPAPPRMNTMELSANRLSIAPGFRSSTVEGLVWPSIDVFAFQTVMKAALLLQRSYSSFFRFPPYSRS